MDMVGKPLLFEPAENAIAKLLPESANGNLASLCNWPDEVRSMSKYKWARQLHWVDTPDLECKYDYNRKAFLIHCSLYTSHASVPKYQDNQTESQLGIPFLVIHSCFINVFSSMPGDCHDSLGRKDVCVVGAINKFTQQLSDYTKNHNTKNRMNISHFAVCFNAASFWFLHKVSSCPQLTSQIQLKAPACSLYKTKYFSPPSDSRLH
jgi:hypothetical protein